MWIIFAVVLFFTFFEARAKDINVVTLEIVIVSFDIPEVVDRANDGDRILLPEGEFLFKKDHLKIHFI